MPLSDIVSCAEDQLAQAITSEEPYQIGVWFMAKNIGSIQLCQLGELLGVASYADLQDGFNLVGDPLPDGPWPETIPTALVASLRGLSDDQIANVAPEWAGMEEFRGTAPPDGLAEYLKELREFLATNSGPFYLVNAL